MRCDPLTETQAITFYLSAPEAMFSLSRDLLWAGRLGCIYAVVRIARCEPVCAWACVCVCACVERKDGMGAMTGFQGV